MPFDPTGKSLLIREYLSRPSRKNKLLDHFRKTEVWFAHPASMQRALWPIVTEREAGMRWPRRSRQTNVASADGEVVWSWPSDAEAK
jgi:hypothetical protein